MVNMPQNSNNLFMRIYQNMFNGNGLKQEAIDAINSYSRQIPGNPQQMVQQLMNSGQMSQGMYNLLNGLAQNIMRFLPR